MQARWGQKKQQKSDNKKTVSNKSINRNRTVHRAACLANDLCELLYEALHTERAAVGVKSLEEILFWQWGRIYALAVSTGRSKRHTTHAAMLEAHGVTWYTYERFRLQSPHVTYLKAALRKKPYYVGCTSAGMIEREGTRRRKHAQSNLNGAEPAIKWWRATKSFYKYVPIVLSVQGSKQEAQVEEMRMIHLLKPLLNTPKVWILVKERAPISHNLKLGSSRLVARARRLHGQPRTWLHMTPPSWKGSDHEKISRTLCELASPGGYSFNIQRRLWNRSLTSNVELYMLHRYATRLEEPRQSFCKGKLNSILRQRELPLPKPTTPCITPFLPHQSYGKVVKKTLRELIQVMRHGSVPLFAPTVCVVEGKWKTVQEKLCNFKAWTTTFKPKSVPKCICCQLPSLEGVSAVDGHLAAKGSQLVQFLNLDREESRVVLGSLQNTLAPTLKETCRRFCSDVVKFCTANGLNINLVGGLNKLEDRLTKIAANEWHCSVEAGIFNEWVQSSAVDSLREKLQGVVWHVEDKKSQQLVAYCPELYHKLLYKTFINSPEVFKLERLSVIEASSAVQNLLPQSVIKSCKWVVPGGSPSTPTVLLPQAYILPKGKNGFCKARPLVPFARYWLRDLHRAIGLILMHITDSIKRGLHFSVKSAIDASSCLRLFNKQLKMSMAEDDSLEIDNQDLVGFFLSIPQEKLLDLACKGLRMFLNSCPKSQASEASTFIVNVKAKHVKCVLGKSIDKRSKRIPVRILVDILQHSLDASIFSVGSCVLRQVRGSLIGSPLSPSWCELYAVLVEIDFFNSLYLSRPLCYGLFSLLRGKTWQAIRYVDNRLGIHMVSKSGQVHTPPGIRSLSFYQEPVILEDEPGLDFVGLRLEIVEGQIAATYIVPGFTELADVVTQGSNTQLLNDFAFHFSEAWRWRDKSGSVKAQLSALTCRIHSASLLSFPLRNARAAICQLLALARALGYDRQVLGKVIQTRSKKFKRVFAKPFYNKLVVALYAPHFQQSVKLLVDMGSFQNF